jgi:hypothetical protein
MKYLFILIILPIYACTPAAKQESTIVSVIVDITDSMTLKPTPALLRIYQADKNSDASFAFRIRTIADKINTAAQECELGTRESMEAYNVQDDPQYRAKNILGFYQTVRSYIDSFNALGTRPLDHSECYAAIASELQALQVSKYDRKRLLVYSDLLQNSEFTGYATEPFSNEQLSRLQASFPLPQRLDGITILIVYLPKTRIDDKHFSITLDGYKRILEPRGAQIILQTNNENYEL